MSTNFYFQSGVPGGRNSEQRLVEGLIIESIKIYGFDTYYLPRTEVARDNLFLEDPASKFQNAIPLEMYLENVDGFAGESTIMSKFGLESRDSATFVVARMRWEDLIGKGRSNSLVLPNRPAEGDLIYLPLTNSFFEIKKVDAHNPFFQLGKLYVYKLECELYQYSSEDFDTGIAGIDSIENNSMDLQQRALALESGDQLQLNGASDDLGILIYEGFSVENNDPLANNDEFNLEAMDILDFSEVNPFGEVVRNV
jgi:hypothetical protein